MEFLCFNCKKIKIVEASWKLGKQAAVNPDKFPERRICDPCAQDLDELHFANESTPPEAGCKCCGYYPCRLTDDGFDEDPANG